VDIEGSILFSAIFRISWRGLNIALFLSPGADAQPHAHKDNIPIANIKALLELIITAALFLLVSISSTPLLSLMRSYLASLSFPATRHVLVSFDLSLCL